MPIAAAPPAWAWGLAGLTTLSSAFLLGLGSTALRPGASSVPNAGSNFVQLGAMGLWLALPPLAAVGTLEGIPPPGGPWAAATSGGVVGILGGFLVLRGMGQLPANGQGFGMSTMSVLALGQSLGTFAGYGLWVAFAPQTPGLGQLAPMQLAPEPYWVPWRLRDNPLNW